MDSENFLSLFFKNKFLNSKFNQMNRHNLVIIIDRNTPFRQLKKVDNDLYSQGYLICGEDYERNFIYINYQQALDIHKKFISKANKRYLKQLGFFKDEEK